MYTNTYIKHKQEMMNEHSVNFIEEREGEDADVHSNLKGSQIFQKVNAEEVEDEEPDDIDILDGYLTYDMSEFHGMLGENIDFDLDDSDSDDNLNSSALNDPGSPQLNTRSQLNNITQNVNHTHLPPSVYNINNQTDTSTQEIRQPPSGSDYRLHTGSHFAQPILEGEEMDPDIDLDMDEIDDDSIRPSDDDDDDLNLFDSIDEELDENNDPYRIMIRYPNEEYKMSEYDIDRKGNQIILRNSEILSDHAQMDDFYHYLKKLGIQKEVNILSFEDLIKHDLMMNMSAIGRIFEQFRDFQQKWLEVCPTYTLSNKLQTYSLQLERFTEMVNFILEFNARNASGRRFTHGRTQFYFTESTKFKQNKEAPRSQRPTFSSQLPQQQQTNPEKPTEENPENIPVECTQMSVVLFKSMELYTQYLQFLHVRRASEQYLKIMDGFKRIRSRFALYQILRCDGVNLTQRYKKSMHFTTFSDGSSPELKVSKANLTIDSFTLNFQLKRIHGLNNYFAQRTELRSDNATNLCTDTQLFDQRLQSHRNRFSSNQYQQFTCLEND